MKKLMNILLMLVVLCRGLHLSHGEKLECRFIDMDYYHFGSLYTCYVSSLDNSFNNTRIDGYTGTHKVNANDNNVKAIWIQGTNMKFIPEGVGTIFNLIVLTIHSSELIAIKSNDFVGMRNLEFLELYGNKLTTVPSNAFLTLTKLKIISLPNNQIEELSSELFSNNLNLEYVGLDDNQIKYIGSESFKGLTKLNKVYLRNNICVNKFYDGTTITDLKQEIKMNCDKANDVIQYEIENKILKESKKNQKEFQVLKKEIEVLNEMIKKLLQKCQ